MANKKSIAKIRKVYEYIAKFPALGLTIKDIAKGTNLNVATVRSARQFLIKHDFIRVVGFSNNGSVRYETTVDTWAQVFGHVSSISNYDGSCAVDIDGYGFDVDGNTYPRHWRILFDTQILKEIADYVKVLPDDEPFF